MKNNQSRPILGKPLYSGIRVRKRKENRPRNKSKNNQGNFHHSSRGFVAARNFVKKAVYTNWKRNHGSHFSVTAGDFKGLRGDDKIKCFACQTLGHRARNCPSKYFSQPCFPRLHQQRRHTHDKTEVLNHRWGLNETVEESIVRYNLDSLQINWTTEALKVAGFIPGVRDKHLIRKLHGIEKFYANWDLRHLVAQKEGEKVPKDDEKVGGKTVHEIYTIGNEAGSPRCDLKRRA
ncbi:hypothetical protein E3N88_07222 [Mikania micrantha]|uniref:CCHC-type domain-containing protein n=1 Tax=Mikania micrantha TaxID=192012 RepID=A0A5N6PSB5_9ASTR|nr:hypothetical protein E3N88_07222 [Mikania micrantha]